VLILCINFTVNVLVNISVNFTVNVLVNISVNFICESHCEFRCYKVNLNMVVQWSLFL
jgi:hypothetical protein